MEYFGHSLSFTEDDWIAIWLTLRLCFYTTIILLTIATPIAWWLANGRSASRTIVQAVVALPLVLPPTVLGFYLLISLGPNGFIGGALENIGLHHLAFTFEGILIGSVLYSLPFAVHPLEQAFSSLGRRPVEVAASFGAGVTDRFISVILPMTKRGFIIAITLSFAHTIGEFGVVLMVGGNIPGITHVLSTTIYGYTEGMQYDAAGRLSLMLLVFSFLALCVVYWLNRRFEIIKP